MILVNQSNTCSYCLNQFQWHLTFLEVKGILTGKVRTSKMQTRGSKLNMSSSGSNAPTARLDTPSLPVGVGDPCHTDEKAEV